MRSVAKWFVRRGAAPTKRHPLFDWKFGSMGVEQFHFARHDVRTVFDCLDCYVSHGETVKHQLLTSKFITAKPYRGEDQKKNQTAQSRISGEHRPLACSVRQLAERI